MVTCLLSLFCHPSSLFSSHFPIPYNIASRKILLRNKSIQSIIQLLNCHSPSPSIWDKSMPPCFPTPVSLQSQLQTSHPSFHSVHMFFSHSPEWPSLPKELLSSHNSAHKSSSRLFLNIFPGNIY